MSATLSMLVVNKLKFEYPHWLINEYVRMEFFKFIIHRFTGYWFTVTVLTLHLKYCGNLTLLILILILKNINWYRSSVAQDKENNIVQSLL